MELLALIIGIAVGLLVGSTTILTIWNIVQKKILKKVGSWVYNFGPKFITKVDDGDYYKFSTQFLDEYDKYINTL